MKNAIIALSLIFSGCSTVVPVKAKFPEGPEKAGAMQNCANLKSLGQDPSISEVTNTINVNYGSYYECAVKVDTWIEWYHRQKQNFGK